MINFTNDSRPEQSFEFNFKLETFNENENDVLKTNAFQARSYSSRKLVLGFKIHI